MLKSVYKILHLVQSKIDNFSISKSTDIQLRTLKKTLYKHRKFLKSEAFLALVRNQSKLKNEALLINYHPFDSKNLMVSEIFDKAASPSFWGSFFRSLVVSKKAKSILELGTNLGIGTEYFLHGLNYTNSSETPASMVTIEGVHAIADFSNNRLKQIIKNENYSVQLHNLKGSFEEMLDSVVQLQIKFDIVFIDGDHSYEGTLKYWELYKETFADNCIVIFDDIYCSVAMRKAWRELRNKPEVRMSIDMFKLGMVIFKKNIKKHKKKPKHYHYHLSF